MCVVCWFDVAGRQLSSAAGPSLEGFIVKCCIVCRTAGDSKEPATDFLVLRTAQYAARVIADVNSHTLGTIVGTDGLSEDC